MSFKPMGRAMEGMNGGNCHSGIHIIVEGGIRKQPKPLGAAGTEHETDEGKELSSSNLSAM